MDLDSLDEEVDDTWWRHTALQEDWWHVGIVCHCFLCHEDIQFPDCYHVNRCSLERGDYSPEWHETFISSTTPGLLLRWLTLGSYQVRY
jgi:hypothetical protein